MQVKERPIIMTAESVRGTKPERLAIANEIIRIISSHGRRFFHHEGRISQFSLDDRGKLWLTDKYTKKRIYVAYKYRWRGFSNGGTLRCLIENLRDFIQRGDAIRRHFGPWPDHLCDGDLWGYGFEAAETMRIELAPVLTRAGRLLDGRTWDEVPMR